MKRILLSLMIMMIALTGIACVSASSDFNDAVDCNSLSDFNGAVVPNGGAVGNDDGSLMELPRDYEKEIGPIGDDDAENDADSIVVDNETEIDENGTGIDVDNDADSIVADNETEMDENNTSIVVNNNTTEKKDNPVVSAEKPKLPLKKGKVIEIPDVDILSPHVDTGNRIDDAVIVYSGYYRAYVSSFGFSWDLRNYIKKPMEALIATVYASFNEGDTITIVSKILSMERLFVPDIPMKDFVKKYFYEEMYYDNSGSNKAKPSPISPGLAPKTPSGPGPNC